MKRMIHLNVCTIVTLCGLLLLSIGSKAQISFEGQVSALSGYYPDRKENLSQNLRYLPELDYFHSINDSTSMSFLASANIYGNLIAKGLNSAEVDGDINTYRLWGRLLYKDFELRLGRQKINFGSATLLRAIQWFDEINPNDPLGFTSGVDALLVRYYFPNNANIWAWSIYDDKEKTYFDYVEKPSKQPQFGARLQYPVSNGEIAISYHHKKAEFSKASDPKTKLLPVNQYAIDGKWDLGIGLWFECSLEDHSYQLTKYQKQTSINLGADYTFGLGNGLNILAEHLIQSYDKDYLAFMNQQQVSVLKLSYPLSMFSNISTSYYYYWANNSTLPYISLDYQFKHLSSYLMVYYNSSNQIQMINQQMGGLTKGVYFNLLLVYKH